MLPMFLHVRVADNDRIHCYQSGPSLDVILKMMYLNKMKQLEAAADKQITQSVMTSLNSRLRLVQGLVTRASATLRTAFQNQVDIATTHHIRIHRYGALASGKR